MEDNKIEPFGDGDLGDDLALLPCPFCGGEGQPSLTQAGGIEWAQVGCVERDCHTMGPARGTEAEAIAAWNQRHSTAALEESNRVLAAENERLRAMMTEAVAASDNGIRNCPINSARGRAPEVCPKCKATASEGCPRTAQANYEAIKHIRSALHPIEQGETE